MIRINEEVFNFELTGNHRQIVSATWGCCPFIPKLNTSQVLLIKVTATQRISPQGV
jgi:hypothetical protein